MDFFQLECFVSVAKSMSFTESSFEMSISQSSLSKYIKKIEEEINVEVFERKNRSIILTTAGQEFLVFAEHTLEEYRNTQNHLKKYMQDGCVHIGCIDNISRLGLTNYIVEFMEDYPTIELKTYRGDTRSLMRNLGENRYDIAIIAHFIAVDGKSNIDKYPLEQYELYTIIEDEVNIIVEKNHRLALKDTINWQDVIDEKIILLDTSFSSNTIIKNSFAHFNIKPNIVFECDQVDTILGMVSSGYGISIMSKRIAQSNYNVKVLKMTPPIQRNTVIVVPHANTSKSTNLFVKYLLECFC